MAASVDMDCSMAKVAQDKNVTMAFMDATSKDEVALDMASVSD